MDWLIEAVIWNTVVGGVVALGAACVGRWGKNPGLCHALWLVVLLILMIPGPARISFPGAEPWGGVRDRGASTQAGRIEASAEAYHGQSGLGPSALQESAMSTQASRSGDPSLGKADHENRQVGRPWAEKVSGADELAVPIQVDIDRWLAAFTWVWGIGALIWLGVAGWRMACFGHRLKFQSIRSDVLTCQVNEMGEVRGLTRTPSVALVDAKVPPLLWGCGKRAGIILPQPLTKELSEAELRSVIAHELAHFIRWDPIWRGVEAIVLGLLWWHPLAWWASTEMRRAEEASCDAWVTQAFGVRRQDYAHALLKTIDFFAGVSVRVPAVACGVSRYGRVKRLKRRISAVLEPRTCYRVSLPQFVFIGGVALFGVGVGGISSQDRGGSIAPPEQEATEIRKDASSRQEDSRSHGMRDEGSSRSSLSARYKLVAVVESERADDAVPVPDSTDALLKIIERPSKGNKARIQALWALGLGDQPNRPVTPRLVKVVTDSSLKLLRL